jgi:hypothetical protein
MRQILISTITTIIILNSINCGWKMDQLSFLFKDNMDQNLNIEQLILKNKMK